jgi:Protoglobin
MTGFSAPDKKSDIAGYDFGSANSARSPVSAEELLQLEQTLGWTTNDAQLLRKHAPLFAAQAERMVDSWRAIIGTQPHLAKWFFGSERKTGRRVQSSR